LLNVIEFFSQSPSATSYRLLSAKNILRPQLKFKEKINNKPGPFIPKIKEKPHSLKPLALLLEINDLGYEEFSHPYEFELERFTPHPSLLLVNIPALNFKTVDETPLVFVDKETSFNSLLSDLKNHSVIGVDLEV
jgi:exosome complex exonuclease RRP6